MKIEINDRVKGIEESMDEKVLAWNCASKSLEHIQDDYGYLENRYHIVEKAIYEITKVVKDCETFDEINATLNMEIQKQLNEIQQKINGGEASFSNTLLNSNEARDTDVVDQINNINIRLKELNDRQIEMEANGDVCKNTL